MMIPKQFETYALWAAPAIGIGLVITYQIGRYQALGVPVELLELDPVKTFITAITIALFGLVSIAGLAVFYQREDHHAKKYRYWFHLGTVLFVTMPFWINEVGLDSKVDWSVIFYIGAVSFGTYQTHNVMDQITGRTLCTEDKSAKLYEFSVLLFWNLLVVSLSTLILGNYVARKEDTRLVLAGTNKIFVGAYNGLLIFKDPSLDSSGKYTSSGVILLPTTGPISLEQRSNISLER